MHNLEICTKQRGYGMPRARVECNYSLNFWHKARKKFDKIKTELSAWLLLPEMEGTTLSPD